MNNNITSKDNNITTTHSYLNYLTLLSIISSFAVVSLHTNGIFWQFSTERYWFTANIIESIYYFAVPIFFMISGVNLLDYSKRYNTQQFFLKRINKTFIPFIFWSFVGLIFRVSFIKDIPIDQISLIYVINGIANTSFIDIYWFFIPLFICYLSIPIISYLPDGKKIKIFMYGLAISIFFNSFLPFTKNIFSLPINFTVHFPIISGYMTYMLLGYILHHVKLTKKTKISLYLLAVLGLLMHIVGTYVYSMDAGKIVQLYKGYLNIPCILYSIGIFLLFKDVGERYDIYSEKKEILSFLSQYTFPVYLLHFFILKIFDKVFIINHASIIYRLCFPIVVFGICILITMTIKKLPGGNKILP
ncbi:acyltransferase [Veillonella magna]|uniref:acyltransferase n=1 Tax=Veillonella magna TaxID=464322 RepID=UPI0023F3EF06|nr:acyltransferase [Veillonella magna]MBD8975128.1 acyltransferase [Veillonella magna]